MLSSCNRFCQIYVQRWDILLEIVTIESRRNIASVQHIAVQTIWSKNSGTPAINTGEFYEQQYFRYKSARKRKYKRRVFPGRYPHASSSELGSLQLAYFLESKVHRLAG